MNIRDKIIAADDIGSELVTVPQWDVTIEVRGLTLGQRNDALTASRSEDGVLNISTYYALIIVGTASDPETHEPIFTFDDAKMLLGKSSKAGDLLAIKALSLSGLSAKGDVGEDVEKAGEESSETETAD